MSDITRNQERLPNTSFNPQYPYNRVTVTEGGHETHTDDTPGNRRIREAHASGTYREISEDGRRVEVTVGNHHSYNKAGYTLTIGENGDIKIEGHARVTVGAGAHVEIAGDATIAVGGNLTAKIMGNAKVGAKNVYIGATETIELNAGTDLVLKAGGKISAQAEGQIQAKGSNISLAGNCYLGQDDLGGTSGPRVLTEGGPSPRTNAKV